MTDWDLRCGRWQDVLADVGEVDAVICDPPYGARTHNNQHESAGDGFNSYKDGKRGTPVKRRSLGYSHWTPAEVSGFVSGWSGLCRGWFVCMTSHDLAPVWERAYADASLYSFAPLPAVIRGMSVRLGGDGPSSWSVWLMVARPKNREFLRWGTLPGAYHGNAAQGGRSANHIGGKPLWLMRQIVKDYTRPGDLVCDPCAGGGTTGRACQLEGRRFIGAEMDPVTHAKAFARLSEPYTPPLFPEVETATQEGLFSK